MWTPIRIVFFCVSYAVVSNAKPILADDVETTSPPLNFTFDIDYFTDYSNVFVECDADHNGKLTFNEFKKNYVDEIVARNKEYFRRIDTNGDGFATQEEIDAYSANIEYEETARILQMYDEYFDGNQDGKLQADEFLRYSQDECSFRQNKEENGIVEDGWYTNFTEYFSKWDKDGDQSWNAEEMNAWNKETITDVYLSTICKSIQLLSASNSFWLGDSTASPSSAEAPDEEQESNEIAT
uniref:EF-hand domain-containing protein n=1 Tax=Plectus sambesii TaxID=2011161 RepID=A0A914XMD1_9BILA